MNNKVGIDLEKGGDDAVGVEQADIPPFQLRVDKLDYFVKVPKGFCKSGQKQILFDISATFEMGTMVALMGPSGAGKTSFLNALANPTSSAFSMNGKPLPKRFSNMTCFIPQDDVLHPALTPRETITYSARLRLPEKTSPGKINAIVEKLLKDLKLVKCADTKVGNEHTRGVSGGEKKRTSCATELVTNPSIVFLDEPTSGLDSKMAEDLLALLKNLCEEQGRLVVTTIHQPSWIMFKQFSKLLMFHHGRVVYHGAGKESLQNYFTSIGFEAPKFENPLDFYMRELQLKDEEDPTFFADKWAALGDSEKEKLVTPAQEEGEKYDEPISDAAMKKMGLKNGFIHQFAVLAKRNAHDKVIDKEKFFMGLMQKLAIGVLIGIVFVGQGRKDTLASAFTRTSPIFFIVLSAVFDTMFMSILEYPTIRPLIVREYRNGAFDFAPYFLAQISVNLAFDMFSSLFYMPAYFIVGLGMQADQILLFLAVLLVLTAAGSAFGLMLGSFAKDIMQAQSYAMPALMPMLLFSGFLLPYAEIPKVFQWIYWVSPFQYAVSTALINEFHDITFSDGLTGEQYLANLDLYLEDIPRNMLILSGIAFGLYVLTFVVVKRSIRKLALGL